VYNHVRGKLVEKTPSRVVVEAGGVGYDLRISLATFESLPPPGAEVKLPVRLLVREDALELVGFAGALEREVFAVLISVNGVGLNLALSVLSVMPPGELAEAVRNQNLAALKRVKGLGTKKAERIVLELRDKVESFGAAAPGAEAQQTPPEGSAQLAAEALVTLGYKRPDAEAAAQRAINELSPGADVTELIRLALTHAK
jgi:holliday junction DNA helicase RuvA